jgi:hypothetical protein
MFKDYTGQSIGNRIVLRFSHFTPRHRDPMWVVRCRCGYEFKSLTQDLKRKECRNCRMRHRRKRPYESLYNAFVHKASKRYTVTLTYEQFVAFTGTKSCHYCGAPISWVEFQANSRRDRYAYHLDRKDNDKPYCMENLVVCCTRCNEGKNRNFSYDEWVKIGNLIRSWKGPNEFQTGIQTSSTQGF